MPIPTEVSNVETKLSGDATHVLAEADHYEMDLISFLAEHKMLALQVLFIVVIPVAFVAFQIGKHFPLVTS